MSTLMLTGLDGGNPLAFLAALGTLRVLTVAHAAAAEPWLGTDVKLSWTEQRMPVLHLAGSPDPDTFAQFLARSMQHEIERHPAAFMLQISTEASQSLSGLFRSRSKRASLANRNDLDWLSALTAEFAPEATSQLQTTRRDYFPKNLASILRLTNADHLRRSLFEPWNYADPLENQSLHLDPSEDRRHAYQWHRPTTDPTRAKRGGMLGANRLAIEAFPIFQSLARGDKMTTLGFSGNRVDSTRWTWPIWSCPISLPVVAPLLALSELQRDVPDQGQLRPRGIIVVFRCWRILVEKTPNFTPAQAI